MTFLQVHSIMSSKEYHRTGQHTLYTVQQTLMAIYLPHWEIIRRAMRIQEFGVIP